MAVTALAVNVAVAVVESIVEVEVDILVVLVRTVDVLMPRYEEQNAVAVLCAAVPAFDTRFRIALHCSPLSPASRSTFPIESDATPEMDVRLGPRSVALD